MEPEFVRRILHGDHCTFSETNDDVPPRNIKDALSKLLVMEFQYYKLNNAMGAEKYA